MDAAGAANDEPSDAASGLAGGMPAKRRSLSHRILSGGAWSLVGRAGSMGSLFLLNVVLARAVSWDQLSWEHYSAYLTAASAIPLLAMLGTMGVPYTLVRVLRVEIADVNRRRDAVRGAMTLTIVGSAIAAAVYWVAAGYFPDEAKWQVLREFRTAVSAWFAFSAICMVAANYMQGIDNFRAASLIGARSGGIIPNLLSLAVVASLWLIGALTLERVLSIQVAAYAIALVVAACWILRTLQSGPVHAAPHHDRAPYASARWFWTDSWPNLINQVIAVLLVEGDLLWVAYLSNEETVAYYGATRYLRLLVTAPLMVASVSLPPFMAELYSRGDLFKLERLIRGAATILAAPALVALLVLVLCPSLVLRVIYGEAFVDAATALQIVSFGGIIYVLTGNNGMTLTMTGHHREALIISLCSMAIYIVISPALVGRYGVNGAAAAFTIQTIVLNVAMTLRAKQVVGIWTIPLMSWSATRDEAVGLLRRLRR